ncbi:WPP domain-interacting tail-anchored protein 1 [Apostasia shenzhenica]|uniref:WPP domain-interacting tail-anchored protein 1 n=1 Tax=Apostasia shenzhenica TaxID=1088818 RepID=A0A2I0AAY5_9ASPA|nr:WPP domain-interacting tail-anchored protein 1 [Apostasia shenzhenica]
MELDLAYSSEKVLNLEILMMQVTDRASDYELQTSSSEELSMDFIEKAFEYDILSGILSSEVKEIESFMSCLQMDILAAHKFTPSDLLEDSLIEIEEKLYHAEESLRNSIDQVADIRKQSAKFERSLAFGKYERFFVNFVCFYNCVILSKYCLQTVEQKRHCLQSLEKSLAREIDLEKKLSESRYNEEELKMKLHFAEQEVDCLEDLFERVLVGFFEAENSAEILLGISKEIIVKVQIAQLSSSSSFLQSEVESEMDKSMMKPLNGQREMKNVETSYTEPDGFPVSVKTYLRTLRCRINALGEQLRETEDHLLIAKVCVKENKEQQSMLYTERGDMDNLISSLKEKVLEIQSRAESAEARCAELIKQSVELNDEVGFLRSNGTEKVKLLERKLKESDSQLEHANASVAAIEEQKNMLYSALNDMQNLIDDLKGKVSKAESRAESAESKCSLLTETNLELNEELTFLRGRLECLEVSLRQSERAKLATAKDICSRTKLIAELVKKLGLEREHLQLQVVACLSPSLFFYFYYPICFVA